ncbi:helix-turn-helix domain-containing protein [Pseudomonas sp. O230]|uniref:helix-turn-helix domain-containing protein n=1 Tax=Pseudomonas sp. O230 TaxID=3159450 RepID=UPI00387B61BB
MIMRESLAAVLRLVRSARGLSKEDLQEQIDPKHLYNLENAKTGITLDMLNTTSSALSVDPLALLVVASCFDKKLSLDDALERLRIEIKSLIDLGVVKGLPEQFVDGSLVPSKAGQRSSLEKIEAVLRCRAQGMTQKEASAVLGVPTSTVNRIWRKPK